MVCPLDLHWENPSAQGHEARMRLFESWWERAPFYVRIGLFVASIAAMVFGGAADAYWE